MGQLNEDLRQTGKIDEDRIGFLDGEDIII